MGTPHIDREYQAQLNLLKDKTLSMGEKVQQMVHDSIQAYIEQNIPTAERVLSLEKEVNRLEIEIDELCFSILAKRQPVASDLRFVMSVLKQVPNLERIGDLAEKVSHRTLDLRDYPKLALPDKLQQIGVSIGRMMTGVLEAFVHKDSEQSASVIAMDRSVDVMCAELFRSILRRIEKSPQETFAAMNLHAVITCLERVGDHITNLAEMNIYMVEGKEVRHFEAIEAAERKVRGIMFLCVHNSARSQMAEGWARSLLPEGIEVFSAGSDPDDRINPFAVRAMREVGIDISGNRPKNISDVPIENVDVVITLCSEEICVDLPALQKSETWLIDDPVSFHGSQDEIQKRFGQIRDEIKFRIETLIRELGCELKAGETN